MGKPYPTDLRERAVAAVLEGGISRRKAAAHSSRPTNVVIRQAPWSVNSLIRGIRSLLRVKNFLFCPKMFPVISTAQQRMHFA